VVSIYDCVMTNDMSRKWQAYLEEVRVTLDVAFRYAMLSPEKASIHTFMMIETTSRVMEVHAFVIGYARFCLATNDNIRDILIDAVLQDGEPLYPSSFIPPMYRPGPLFGATAA
jgi:hypothetical protein